MNLTAARFPRWSRLVALLLLGVFLFMGSVKPACAADDTSQESTGSDVTASSGLYQPPEGTDKSIVQEFLGKLMQMPSPDRTPAGLRAHFQKLQEVADILFARPLDDETALRVIRLKVGALGILDQLGDPQAAKLRDEFLAALKANERPVLALQGRLLETESMLSRLQTGDPSQARQVVDRVVELLKSGPIEESHVALALGTSQALEGLGDVALAGSANRMMAKYLRTSMDESVAAVADLIEGTARRLELPGHPARVKGKLLNGKEFDLSQYKGQVVLVDFWATWCGPCVAEMPHLKQLYEAYHDKGLEIVGVSLDENGRRLRSFVGLHEVPWPILFDEETAESGQGNPIATYYGITGIPTMFLVGPDGNVAAVNLYGSALDERIEELIQMADRTEVKTNSK